MKQRLRRNQTILHSYRKVRDTVRKPPKPHKFTSMLHAVEMTDEFAEQIPNEFDVIVGIPRAGLIVANIIASKYGRPLSTPDMLLKGEMWYSHDNFKPIEIKSILLVEECVGKGKQLKESRDILQQHFPNATIKTASLFKATEIKKSVKLDYCYKGIHSPTTFEWNILTQAWSIGELCTDCDGVINKDYTSEELGDFSNYRELICKAMPYLIPQFPIKAIITSRLEKYRSETESWLKNHGVQYENLLMLDCPSESQRTSEMIINFKAEAINYLKPAWYWESSVGEAMAIAKKTRVPILCIGNMSIYKGRKVSIFGKRK